MSDGDLENRLKGAGLLTAEILYRMPDHPAVLQTFCFQKLDHAPAHAAPCWRGRRVKRESGGGRKGGGCAHSRAGGVKVGARAGASAAGRTWGWTPGTAA